MRKFFLALLVGALPYALWPPLGLAVFFVVLALLLLVPGNCPFCGKMVRLGFNTCSHCGRSF